MNVFSEKFTKDFEKTDFLKSQNLYFLKQFIAFGPTIPKRYDTLLLEIFLKIFFEKIF